MNKWKQLASKLIFDHPRIKIWEDDVELPSGHRTTYVHYGEPRHSATVIAINSDGKLLIQKEYSYPPNDWLYQFPGGGIEEGETPKDGAVRELQEEGGFTGELTQIGWYYRDNRRSAGKMYVFVAQNLSEIRVEKDLEEEFESYWLTKEEIEDLISNGEFTNYSGLAAWTLYTTWLQQ